MGKPFSKVTLSWYVDSVLCVWFMPVKRQSGWRTFRDTFWKIFYLNKLFKLLQSNILLYLISTFELHALLGKSIYKVQIFIYPYFIFQHVQHYPWTRYRKGVCRHFLKESKKYTSSHILASKYSAEGRILMTFHEVCQRYCMLSLHFAYMPKQKLMKFAGSGKAWNQ